MRPRYMKKQSVKVPALKSLLDRPLDLGCLELADQAFTTAGFGATSWPFLTDVLISVKRYGSSPERVLDLLCFLNESSDEVLQKMDLDDTTVEHLTAGRSALREVIGKVELAVKKGTKWNCLQVAPWLWSLRRNGWSWWPSLGSEELPRLQTLDARAGILMRLEHEAEKENDTSLQEVA